MVTVALRPEQPTHVAAVVAVPIGVSLGFLVALGHAAVLHSPKGMFKPVGWPRWLSKPGERAGVCFARLSLVVSAVFSNGWAAGLAVVTLFAGVVVIAAAWVGLSRFEATVRRGAPRRAFDIPPLPDTGTPTVLRL